MGNDFPANQVMCYSGFGYAERQILFSDVKEIHGGSGVMEHAMVIVSPLRRSVWKSFSPFSAIAKSILTCGSMLTTGRKETQHESCS